MTQEIYLRAHTVAQTGKKKTGGNALSLPIWPERILVFDTETTIDARQELTFGVYWLCELKSGKYICSEEGLFHDDDLDERQLTALKKYVETQSAQIEVKSFPPRLDLKLYPRWEFLEKIFWKAIKNERMIVGFNLPFDLSRLAVEWAKADDGGWSLILSQRCSKQTGLWEANPYRPRVRITAKDSKSAFISLTKPQKPDEWPPRSRFLDVHTLAFSLFGQSFSLDALCRSLKVTGKLNHEPTGRVTSEEIDYCRGDVRATVTGLNALKQEFDRYELDLRPDQAYSPASLAKAHLRKMGVIPPKEKFALSEHINGIAMQAYYGGRAECRIRKTTVPVAHTDFKSQYPTVNTLLGNWKVLTADSVSFEPASLQVRKLLKTVTLSKTFDPAFWKELSFFALVEPDEDVLPIRTVYNGQTQNIGINKLSSDTPIWFAGPDLVASALLTGKSPRIIKAIRMVPHGTQKGLNRISLYGTIDIDPHKDDFFRYVIEQRERNSSSNRGLAGFLKVLANSGSYGLFVEVTPDTIQKPTAVKVFSGDTLFEQQGLSVENHGAWYFPPLASLITAGGRLLLAMLEKSVSELNGTYLFCDTDSMCIVATESGGSIDCDGAEGSDQIHTLSWKEVESICNRFRLLSPYDRNIVSDLLKIENVNFNSDKQQRRLLGYAISAKRYALFERVGEELNIIDPKAHGLGYLYPPADSGADNRDWTFAAWEWLLRNQLGLTNIDPEWLDLPAMMRVRVSTPNVLKCVDKMLRPFNFVLCPLIDTLVGYPAGIDRDRFALLTSFTKNRDAWMKADCINIHDGSHHSLSFTQTPRFDKVIPQTFSYILRLYPFHPESKSLAPDGSPCTADTRGVLQRIHVTAMRTRFIGKETDRKWEHGEDFSLLAFKPTEFDDLGKIVKASPTLIEQLAPLPIKAVARKANVDRNTIRKIMRGLPVRPGTLQRIAAIFTRLSV
ncbi:DNA polymerase [Tunturiibacter gelidoferens]|uniref:DNA-directed DNA polymerase n=1 Tax=Tunturiibacter gelidiferens TaxID=3069689 RepID=A0A9X0QDJ6_9BACT|nr:DNA polymerase [Edaphobacter lichenicola]MBB5328427.1 hypothetical protein [Edaphobacter lichenicola]